MLYTRYEWAYIFGTVCPERAVAAALVPPYAPELNPVENVWQFLRQNKLAIRVFETYEDIVDACCQAWLEFIEDPSTIASITKRNWANVS